MSIPSYISVERKKVKHARLRVSESGTVRLIVPTGLSKTEVEGIYKRKAKWVDEKRSYFFRRAVQAVPRRRDSHWITLHGEPYHFSYNSRLGTRTRINHAAKVVETGLALNEQNVLHEWYRKYAKRNLREATELLASQHRVGFKGKLYVRNAATKWGNCSSRGNISLNWRLVLVPPSARDYVVLHELLHTKVRNHSKVFWVKMRALMPRYREAVRILDAYIASTGLSGNPDAKYL